MAPLRKARRAPFALALIAGLAATACQREAAESAPSTTAAPDSIQPAAPQATPASMPSAAPTAYDCGGTAVEARFDGDNATVLIDGEAIPLATVPSASGSRYQGARADGLAVELWTKGAAATLSVAGNAYPECATVGTDAQDASQAMSSEAAYRAQGNEPSWSIETVGDELRWTTPDAPAPVVWDGVTRTDRTDGFDLAAAASDGRALALAATTTLCRDSMSGMPYPQTVVVTVDQRAFDGCGGDPRELLTAHEWAVASLGGSPPGDTPPTLQFMAEGSAGGFAGCNRWMAAATLTGEGLAFNRPASTMMACPEVAMATEQAFLAALARVTRHDFDANGDLLLKAGDETLIVAQAGPLAGP